MCDVGRSAPVTGNWHREAAAHAILDRLADVGLGYLSLGQPLTTLHRSRTGSVTDVVTAAIAPGLARP
jgi:hypothetical protein